MNARELNALVQATLDGAMPFTEVVGRLIANDVESYRVDYASRTFTFYSAAGDVVSVPLAFDKLPAIAEDLDLAALKAAIWDSQQHGQKFQAFCERAVQAGVQGYVAYLRGQRVTYSGRQGDQHTEWFPGANLNDV